MKVLQVTPVFIVPRIEDQLPFWKDRLGYEIVAEVPHGDSLGFVILVRGGSGQVMLQTIESVHEDLPACIPYLQGAAVVEYITVESLDDVTAKLDPTAVIQPRRTTSYGMHEVWVRTPSGHIVGFSEAVK